MAARDLYHDVVVRALVKDSWTITDDPLKLSYGTRDMYVDLGAYRTTLGAEKAGRKIAVEIKSFLNPSAMNNLKEAVGQYTIYQTILAQTEPDRLLYMAIPYRAYESVFVDRFGQLMLKSLPLQLIVFDPDEEEILLWIPELDTKP